jgi:predicted PhzF superfamily epimerase YddE/YHI9
VGLAEALGAAPERYLKGTRDGIVVFRSQTEVATLQPDFGTLKRLFPSPLIATAPGDGVIDFVSRFFAPHSGIDEDQVTDSAHCVLIPYWSERLDKAQLRARQISKRGSAARCAATASPSPGGLRFISKAQSRSEPPAGGLHS